jgi:broad specificity phosphatase PhoE
MAQRILYLVRHGQQAPRTTVPAEDDGLGTGLTRLGVQQAKAVARRLRDVPLAAIHTSTLRRAAQTAKALAGVLPNVPVYGSPELWEAMPAVPAGLPVDIAAALLIQANEDESRINDAFDLYFKPPDGAEDVHEALVCHGNLIRFFVCRALQVPTAAWANMLLHNAALTVIHVEEDGRRVLVSHNDLGHLPPEMRTLS